MNGLAKHITTLSPEKRALLLQKMQEKMVSQHLQQKKAGNAQQQILPQKRNSDTFALSFAQERLWFLHQLNPHSATYHVPSVLRLQGEVSIATLERSLAVVIQRHEILRTVFQEHEGEPVQVIKPSLSLHLPVIDLCGRPQREQEELLRQLSHQEGLRPFDFATGPLLRTRVLRLDEHEHVLLFNMHHIISDGWSMSLLRQEFSLLYQAEVKGEPANLPALPIQYADYALWQRAWLQGEVLQKQLDYWRQQLTGAPAILHLPTDRPRPAVQANTGAMQTLLLPLTLLQELKQLSQREGATLFMTLLAAFKVLLMRYSGEPDIVVGSPIANRRQDELKNLLGFFVNILVLRTDLRGHPSFLQLLARVRKVALQAYEHQDLPFEKLVESLHVERSLSHGPLFQVLFALQNMPSSDLKVAGVSWIPLESEHFTTMFDLSLMLFEGKKGLRIEVEYSTALFNETTITRMLSHWQVLLEAIVHAPEQPIETLPLLTPQERELVAYGQPPIEIGASPVPTRFSSEQASNIYPNMCLHQLFEQQVEQTPDAIAVVFEDGGTVPCACPGFTSHLTYQQLNAQANQLAHLLRQEGIGPDKLVGVCLERSLELVVALLAIHKAGGAYVPLDPKYPAKRLAFMLDNAQISLVVFQLSTGLVAPDTTFFQTICLDRDWSRIAEQERENLASGVQVEHLAYVIYTSGSTGTPKGVAVEHRAIANRLLWSQRAFPLTSSDRVLQMASVSFDIALWELFGPLIAGARVVLAPQDAAQDSGGLIHSFIEQAVTIAHAVPSLLRIWLQEPAFSQTQDLRHLFCGGEAWWPGLAERFTELHHAHLTQWYGPTEAAISMTSWTCPVGVGQAPTLGRPIANTRVYLLAKNGQPVPIGVTGEMYLGGVCLARGYLGQAALTAERFVPNPCVVGVGSMQGTGERLYRTGDRARYLADGQLEFLGRMDQQVKARGIRVELGEIEAVLLQHPAVREAVVLVEEDALEDKSLRAYLVLQPEQAGVELWPSIGEYFVYDELIYTGLTNDEARNALYKVALEQTVAGKVVVDVGTGRDAILARLCVEAGARRVYAIEMLSESYQHAQAYINQLGLQEQIKVLHGDATQVQLPERAEVCVTEIFEAIGGAEGAGVILNNIGHLLTPQATMIPSRSLTKIAAASLPDELREKPAFTEVSSQYVRKIFEQVGHPFDLRLCIKNFPLSHLVSQAEIFEDLDYTSQAEPEYSRQVRLTITQQTRLDGFLLWLILDLAPGQTLDILEGSYSWFPVYFPVFSPGIEVDAGDVIEMVCQGVLSENGINPDYSLHGRVVRQNREPVTFTWTSYHHQACYRQTDFYQRLFSEDTLPVRKDDHRRQGLRGIREHLRTHLPESLLPNSFVLLESLPLLPNGKLDRHALPQIDQQHLELLDAYVAPRTPMEEILVSIWGQILKLERVGIHDNFFELGGHSLLAVQLLNRVNQRFSAKLSLTRLFQMPTIAQIASQLEQHSRPEAASAGLAQGTAPASSLIVPFRMHGSKPPVYFVHPASGDLYLYTKLLPHLPQDRPFYGIQAQGLTDAQEPLVGIETMAAVYVDALLQVQPKGPYLLGGFSFGGTVALEMARCLRAQGRDVALLVLMDSKFFVKEPSATDTFDETRQLIAFAETLQRARGQGKATTELSYHELHRLTTIEKAQALLEHLKAEQIFPQETRLEVFHKQLRIVRAHRESQLLYRPQEPYQGDLVFLCPQERAYDPVSMWQPFVTGKLLIHTIPGEHLVMMREPSVQSVAAELQRYL